MNNKIVLFTVAMAVGIIFSSCKKSENDPSFSLSSRDARIKNAWELTSLTRIIEEENSLGIKDIKQYVFDGTTMTLNHKNIYGGENETTYSYSDKLEILDNNFYNQTIVENGNKTITQAYWYWHDSNKDKTGISFDNGIVYSINRLAKDELILKYVKYTTEIDEDGDEISIIKEESLTYSAE